jgi:hypothetical protein
MHPAPTRRCMDPAFCVPDGKCMLPSDRPYPEAAGRALAAIERVETDDGQGVAELRVGASQGLKAAAAATRIEVRDPYTHSRQDRADAWSLYLSRAPGTVSCHRRAQPRWEGSYPTAPVRPRKWPREASPIGGHGAGPRLADLNREGPGPVPRKSLDDANGGRGGLDQILDVTRVS